MTTYTKEYRTIIHHYFRIEKLSLKTKAEFMATHQRYQFAKLGQNQVLVESLINKLHMLEYKINILQAKMRLQMNLLGANNPSYIIQN